MLNSNTFYNSRPDGFAILEVVRDEPADHRQFVPLKLTQLSGTVTGPLAGLTLTQTFSLPTDSTGSIEALYRFPLPGDAAVTGVRVRFGEVEIHTTLKERTRAEEEYWEAKREGKQAALVTRESPDVFTLAVAGIRSGEDVVVATDYVQLARPEGKGWSLRVPLTTSPRFVREDEAGSRHAAGQPLAVLRDPGHRFSLDLTVENVGTVSSATHRIAYEWGRVRLSEGEVFPDRDCILTWQPKVSDRPTLSVWTYSDSAGGKDYFLGLCSPPRSGFVKTLPREVILLVDHSGSMEGAKWEATDWAVERFLASLSPEDSFALGLFHDSTNWLSKRPQKATAEVVRAAVAFLKSNRDSGGTQLGVALEEALDQPRAANIASRHVLILTDAEVSDAGRVLRLAEGESARPDNRRVSVLCIDSAPNEALATQLAERGGGVSRFLTSSPDEEDITTALDEVLEDWSAPVLVGLTLEVNRAGVEAMGRLVSVVSPGPASAIDLGDLPAGRPVWVAGRVASGTEPLSFQLRGNAELIAQLRADGKKIEPALKALFGADRLRRLEYVMNGHFSNDELCTELSRLGCEVPPSSGPKLYPENVQRAAAESVRVILVRESLECGLPSSETAFVAVREEPGQPLTETRIVANALPKGWSDGSGGRLLAGGGYGGSRKFAAPSAPADDELRFTMMDACTDISGDVFEDEVDSETLMGLGPVAEMDDLGAPAPPPVSGMASASAIHFPQADSLVNRLNLRSRTADRPDDERVQDTLRVVVRPGQHAPADGSVLHDAITENGGHFTYVAISFADTNPTVDSVNPELTLLLFVGDLASPRARVKLENVLRQGGRRPLNLRHAAGEPIRMVLSDPAGAWKSGIPPLEIVLG